MDDIKQIAQAFLAALAANAPAPYEAVLGDDVGLLIAAWNGGEIHRPRARVMRRLMEEWSAWPDPSLETFNVLADGDQAAVEFRIQATEHDRYVEHNRSAFLKIRDGKIQLITLYCPEPIPSAHRKGWIAPATLTDDELQRLFESMAFAGDPREWQAPDSSSRASLRGATGGNDDPHPGSNMTGIVRWTAEEADRRIEEVIAHHRERNIGFQWIVTPADTPTDLRERLERHGLMLAGDAATMARLGLDDLDIPVNPGLSVQTATADDDEATLDAIVEICRIGFNWPDAQAETQRAGWRERLRNEHIRETEIDYLACLDGRPVGVARLQLNGGVAYLGGAATLPEFRGRRVYSTLLRRRLEDAHARGYHLAAINAEPMSRRVVTRYGFKEYARIYIYAWMPVMDPEVIKSLVPQ
jgi:GNAT superfamily N-acetyltransferase/ketosteroid isomerase-like protein